MAARLQQRTGQINVVTSHLCVSLIRSKSYSFLVKVGLHQVNRLSLILFLVFMNRISLSCWEGQGVRFSGLINPSLPSVGDVLLAFSSRRFTSKRGQLGRRSAILI